MFITYLSWIASVSMTSFLEPSMTLARASCLMLLSILVTSSWCGWRGRRAAMGQVLAEWLVVDSRLVLAIDGRRLLNSLRVMTVLPSLPAFTVYTFSSQLLDISSCFYILITDFITDSFLI